MSIVIADQREEFLENWPSRFRFGYGKTARWQQMRSATSYPLIKELPTNLERENFRQGTWHCVADLSMCFCKRADDAVTIGKRLETHQLYSRKPPIVPMEGSDCRSGLCSERPRWPAL